MKHQIFSSFLYSAIYKTTILYEMTNNNQTILYFLLVTFNEAQLLRFLFFPSNKITEDITLIQQFVQYLARPHLYFFHYQQQLEYSILAFMVIKLILIYWYYLLFFCSNSQQKESYIQVIQHHQQSSGIKQVLLFTWKYIFLFLTNCLGFQLIEGALMIIFNQKDLNVFCLISSITLIIEMLLIIVFQDLYLNQSLHYLPQRVNQQIQTTHLTTICKLLLLMTIAIYASELEFKSIMISIFSLIQSVLSLYVCIIMKTIINVSTIWISCLCQSIIFSLSLEQIVSVCVSAQLSFFWVLLSLLMLRVLYLYYERYELTCLQTIKHRSIHQMILMEKLKLNYFNILAYKQNSQFKILSKIIVRSHQKQCHNVDCYCRNEDLRTIKIQSILLKQGINDYNVILKVSHLQSTFFYINLIQALIFQQHYFEALNLSQKVLNSLNLSTSLYKKRISLIKERSSIKDSVILKVLQQITLISLRFNIQRNTHEASDYDTVSYAVRSYQVQCDCQKELLDGFDTIVKTKIDILILITNSKRNLNSKKINQSIFKAIKVIETFKEQLENKFRLSPTQQNQSLLLFFQVELLNDLINSQTINNMNTMFEEQEKYFNANLIYQQISTQYSYIKIQIKDEDTFEMEQIVIKRYFNKLKSNFISFYDLIPDSLSQVHKYYIRNFFKNGLNKFYLNMAESFLKIRNGVIMPIDMCMDFSFDSKTNSLFATIFMKKSSNSLIHYIFLDSEYKIKEISQILYYKILNFSQSPKMVLFDQQITEVIPDFHRYRYQVQTELGPCNLFFPTGSELQSTGSQFHSLQKYFGIVNINVKKIGKKALYFIVEISNLKSQRSTIDLSPAPLMDIDEKEIIEIPFDIQQDQECGFMNLTIQQQNVNSRLDSSRPLLQTRIAEGDYILPEQQQSVSKDSNIVSRSKGENESPATNNIAVQIDDVGSQISSVAAIRRSLYFSQYQTINSLIISTSFPNNVRKFNIFFCTYIFIVITNVGLLTNEVQQLTIFTDYISLLSIKYDIYEPIESFLNTRYTIVCLNQALADQVITQQLYSSLVGFPKSNLVRGYDDLKEKIFQVISKSEFQPFLEDRYFVSKWYESTQKESEKNITFRSGILSLLNYQYSFKLGYTVYALQTDGPYFFYSYKNYIALFTIFTELNNNVLNSLINTLTDQARQLTVVSAPLEILSGIFGLINLIYLIKQRSVKNKILNLLSSQNNEVIQNEIQRLFLLQNRIKTNQQLLYQYRLDLVEFDKKLQQQEKEYQKLTKSLTVKFSNRKENVIKIYNVIQSLILILNFLLYATLLFFTLDALNSYLSKMQNSAVIYQKLSNSGVDVLIIFAQKEVLYRRSNLLIFDEKDIQDLLQQVDNSLQSIKEVSSAILAVNQNDYLLDDNSFQVFQDVTSLSLCQYLPQELEEMATSLCPQVLQGVLTQGLQSTLLFMYNTIYLEKQINNFTFRNTSQVPIRELEGATFTAKVIKQLVISQYQNLVNQTNMLENSFTIIYILFIVIELLIVLSILQKYNSFERKQINSLRKIVYLLPQGTLIFDEQFSRSIKYLILSERLI